jgi:DNA invertase Pin-like site-specific DNA recombinase
MTARHRYIAYFRVSTDKQGHSGLGLDAQRAAVQAYLTQGAWTLQAEFTEVESGRRADRPVLARALAACRAQGAILVIAKLDRLARNVAFISNLMDSGVEFVAVDFPQANRLTLHILAAVAEHERDMISARTKAALVAAKARGVKLGGSAPLTEEQRAAGRVVAKTVKTAKAAARAADLLPIIHDIRADGITSATGIAKVLNARGVPPPSGRGAWQNVTVQRVLATASKAAG